MLLINTGDDCISIGTGCSDVDIQGVTCGPSHGIRFLSFHFFPHLFLLLLQKIFKMLFFPELIPLRCLCVLHGSRMLAE